MTENKSQLLKFDKARYTYFFDIQPFGWDMANFLFSAMCPRYDHFIEFGRGGPKTIFFVKIQLNIFY